MWEKTLCQCKCSSEAAHGRETHQQPCDRTLFLKSYKLNVSGKTLISREVGKDLLASSGFLQQQTTYTREKSNSRTNCVTAFQKAKAQFFSTTHSWGERMKSFSHKHILVQHQRVLSRDRCFLSSGYGKSFSKSCSLIRHQSVHTGERAFEYEECGIFNNTSHDIEHWKRNTL